MTGATGCTFEYRYSIPEEKIKERDCKEKKEEDSDGMKQGRDENDHGKTKRKVCVMASGSWMAQMLTIQISTIQILSV